MFNKKYWQYIEKWQACYHLAAFLVIYEIYGRSQSRLIRGNGYNCRSGQVVALRVGFGKTIEIYGSGRPRRVGIFILPASPYYYYELQLTGCWHRSRFNRANVRVDSSIISRRRRCRGRRGSDGGRRGVSRGIILTRRRHCGWQLQSRRTGVGGWDATASSRRTVLAGCRPPPVTSYMTSIAEQRVTTLQIS